MRNNEATSLRLNESLNEALDEGSGIHPSDSESGPSAEGTSIGPMGTSLTLDDTLKENLEQLMGTTKAVRRRSGGLVCATPIGLVLLHGKTGQDRIGVQVKFYDFAKKAQGRHIEPHGAVFRKVIALTELLFAFPNDFSNQQFGLDFGQGLVPIKVIHSTKTSDSSFVYFTQADALERAIQNPREGRLEVYHANAALLRWLGPSNNGVPSVETQRAKRTYEALVASRVEVFPRGLLFAEVALEERRLDQSLREYLLQKLKME